MCWQMTKKISKVQIVLPLFTCTFPYLHARDFINFSSTTLLPFPTAQTSPLWEQLLQFPITFCFIC